MKEEQNDTFDAKEAFPMTLPLLFAWFAQRDDGAREGTGSPVYFRRFLETLDIDDGGGTANASAAAEEITSETFWRMVQTAAVKLKPHINGTAHASSAPSPLHIALCGADDIIWLVCFCAVQVLGGTAVLLDPRLPPEMLLARAELADVSLLLYDSLSEETAAAVLHTAVLKHTKNGMRGCKMEPLCRCMDRRWKEIETEAEYDGVCAAPVRVPVPDDLSCILFTSGTTEVVRGGTASFGRGKAVMLSHRAMTASICQDAVGIPFTSQLAVMPFHHIAGIVSVFNTLYLGAVVCMAPELKNLFRYLKVLEPDYMLCVPSVMQSILRRLRGAGQNGEKNGWHLQLLSCGGAAFPRETIAALHAQGIRVLQSYGATELGGIGLETEMTEERAGILGNLRENSAVEAKLVDGELYIRCASMMKGYYRDKAATAEVLVDGFYATGDLCRLEENGDLYLLGRKSNRIVLPNGENICPEEIEQQLCMRCSAIEELMVGADSGVLWAEVYLSPSRDRISSDLGEDAGAEDAANVVRAEIDAYNDLVPPFLRLYRLSFRDTPFPKNALGKLLR
ncbi:MAG: AMP-binding protein [Clostridia bacterium]|nr:AMP-binding protein [Clostridia bacterium]